MSKWLGGVLAFAFLAGVGSAALAMGNSGEEKMTPTSGMETGSGSGAGSSDAGTSTGGSMGGESGTSVEQGGAAGGGTEQGGAVGESYGDADGNTMTMKGMKGKHGKMMTPTPTT